MFKYPESLGTFDIKLVIYNRQEGSFEVKIPNMILKFLLPIEDRCYLHKILPSRKYIETIYSCFNYFGHVIVVENIGGTLRFPTQFSYGSNCLPILKG